MELVSHPSLRRTASAACDRPPTKAVVHEFCAAIHSGAIPAGTRHPAPDTPRSRASGGSSWPRPPAYAEPAAWAWTWESRAGERSSGCGPATTARTITHSAGAPDGWPAVQPAPGPVQGDQLRQALRTMAMSGDIEALLRRHPPGGHRHDRVIVATCLLGQGIDTVPQHVLQQVGQVPVVAGCQSPRAVETICAASLSARVAWYLRSWSIGLLKPRTLCSRLVL